MSSLSVNRPCVKANNCGQIRPKHFNPRQFQSRNTQPQITPIDRRTTRILISNIDTDLAEIKDVLLKIMNGELVETSKDADGKTIMIQYKTRKEAERAMLKGNQYVKSKISHGKRLNLSWVPKDDQAIQNIVEEIEKQVNKLTVEAAPEGMFPCTF